MHYLHKILVYIPDAVSAEVEMTKEEKMDAVRSYADDQTADYYGSVFDWRETDCAGRWTAEFPQNVIFASDDIDEFINQIERAIDSQKAEIAMCLNFLREKNQTELERFINGELARKSLFGDAADEFTMMSSYYLYVIAAILHGEYRADSYIFNLHEYTTRIFPDDIESICQEPKKWAMVMFDCHN